MFELKYDEYSEWHERASASFLEPAKETALRLIDELLDKKVSPVDRGRFRISSSRVKSAQRTFAKLNQPKYLSKLKAHGGDLEKIPGIIDDLVGIRLICNNLSDINTFKEIIDEQPIFEGGAFKPLCVEKNSTKDYFAEPKASGYRAFHANIVVIVPSVHSNRNVTVEIQARTLLQDGWGELTHEDTYKPGSTVPDWIVRMSLRMADLLAAIDDIAQDLRTGLDTESQRALLDANSGNFSSIVADGTGYLLGEGQQGAQMESSRGPDSGANHPQSDKLGSALKSETHSIVSSLEKPMALAVLSQKLTSTFGSDIKSIWTERGGFKKYLQEIVPDALLSGPAPGYIHPLNTSIPDGWTTEDTGTGEVPDIVRELRILDKALPLVGPDRMNQIISAVVDVLVSEGRTTEWPANLGGAEIDRLARLARSAAEGKTQLVVRPHAAYVLNVINHSGQVNRVSTIDDVRLILRDHIVFMAINHQLVEDSDQVIVSVNPWLGIEEGMKGPKP